MTSNDTPRYTNVAQIKLNLRGKVIQDYSGDTVQNSLTPAQYRYFINCAESRVEVELSRQYLIPFQGNNQTAFSTLPKTTQFHIQQMCNYKCVEMILVEYFGVSEGDRGWSYLIECRRCYEELKNQACGKDDPSSDLYRLPPLAGLAVNANASYRTTAGAKAPLAVEMGSQNRGISNVTRSKLTNLNNSLWYGWYPFGFWRNN